MPLPLTPEQVSQDIENFRKRDIILMSPYTKASDKHIFACLKPNCNYEWETTYNHVKNGRGCPKCAGFVLTPDLLELDKKNFRDRFIELISPFTKTRDKHKFKCLKPNCNYEWEAKYSSVKKGSGCPKCAGMHQYQHKEGLIYMGIRN
jgi:hypothetical protein